MSMPISQPTLMPSGNKLLDGLPPHEYNHLRPHLQQVPLELEQLLFESRTVIEYVYFPRAGVVSMVTLMEDSRSIEVATVGREGVIGLAAMLGDEKTLGRFVVQIP